MGDPDELPFLAEADPDAVADAPASAPPGTPAPPVAPPAPAAAKAAFQASAGIQGRQFAEQCDTLLRHQGYELLGRRVLPEVGVEIDQEARSPSGTII